VVSSKGRISIGGIKVAPALMSQVPRGISYRRHPSEIGAATDLKPNWSSWTGVQVAYVRLPTFTASDVRVPYAYLALLSGGVGALLMFRRYWKTRPGLCCVCGYSLANNVSGVCPECGTAISPPTNDFMSLPKS
jgi:hypothetical protein